MASHPAVSAHGPRAGTVESYAHALKTGAEYVEFDIRRTADGNWPPSTILVPARASHWPGSATPGCANWLATRYRGWPTS